MLFRRYITPSCSYCRFGSSIGGGEIACTKRGITTEGGSCPKFRYDALRREPERPRRPSQHLIPPELAAELTEEMTAERIVESEAAQRVRETKVLNERLSAVLAMTFAPEQTAEVSPEPLAAAAAASEMPTEPQPEQIQEHEPPAESLPEQIPQTETTAESLTQQITETETTAAPETEQNAEKKPAVPEPAPEMEREADDAGTDYVI